MSKCVCILVRYSVVILLLTLILQRGPPSSLLSGNRQHICTIHTCTQMVQAIHTQNGMVMRGIGKLSSFIDLDRESLKAINIYYICIFKEIQCLAANIKFYLVNTSIFNKIQCSCANSKIYLVNIPV